MFSKEKITIRLNRLTRNFSFHFLFWAATLSLYLFLVGKNHIFAIYFIGFSNESVYAFALLLSIANALIFTLVDGLFTDKIMRFFPIQFMILLKSTIYFLAAFLMLFLAAMPTLKITHTQNYREILLEIPARDIVFLRFLVYFYISCFINSFAKNFIKRIGRGNMRRWLFGFMNKPTEQERIFMFIDLKGSTTIAEKLLHKKFSHLVQDVFNDLAMVDNYGGEIYQYLGDGAIVSWNLKTGLKNNNCIQAFFAFTKLIARRKRYYQRKYGLEPKFKAGIHVGKVMVLQVGQIRRDISYNGDTLNTAARIESQCNELKQSLMISGQLYEMLEENEKFRFKNLGNMQLRGKRKSIEIFGVNLKHKK